MIVIFIVESLIYEVSLGKKDRKMIALVFVVCAYVEAFVVDSTTIIIMFK